MLLFSLLKSINQLFKILLLWAVSLHILVADEVSLSNELACFPHETLLYACHWSASPADQLRFCLNREADTIQFLTLAETPLIFPAKYGLKDFKYDHYHRSGVNLTRITLNLNSRQALQLISSEINELGERVAIEEFKLVQEGKPEQRFECQEVEGNLTQFVELVPCDPDGEFNLHCMSY